MIEHNGSYLLVIEDLPLLLDLARDAYANETEIVEDIPDPEPENLRAVRTIFETAAGEWYGLERHPKLEDKAAHIFYSLIKNHPLQNGNKRLAVICSTFLVIVNVGYAARQKGVYLSPTINFSQINFDTFYDLTLQAEATDPVDYERVKAELSLFFAKFADDLEIVESSGE